MKKLLERALREAQENTRMLEELGRGQSDSMRRLIERMKKEASDVLDEVKKKHPGVIEEFEQERKN